MKPVDQASPPEISVIIPHLNQADLLRKCLVSLRDQTFDMTKVEIIVVDNGSKEMPEALCAEFGVRLEREATPGPGPARNKGISVSRAPILAFIDADCTADPKWLSAIDKAFTDPAMEIIGGDVRISVEQPGRMTAIEAYESEYAYRMDHYIARQGFTGTGNLAVRRAVLNSVGLFAGISVAEDREWGQRATRAGFHLVFRPEAIVFHPARKSAAELFVKWDRHIAHDYRERIHGLESKAFWGVKALAMFLSPGIEIGRIATSDRLETLYDRVLAWFTLARIRAHRGWRMVNMLLQNDAKIRSGSWNRK
jgi:glycosyltransferase involved in cell wall biosynthesis